MKITHPIAHPRTYFWYLKSNFLRKYFLYNQGDSGVPLVRDQEVGGSNPLAPTNPFSTLRGLVDQTAHPTAHPVPKLPLGVCAPILRPWQRTQPPAFPQDRPGPHNPLLLVPRLLLLLTSMFATS